MDERKTLVIKIIEDVMSGEPNFNVDCEINENTNLRDDVGMDSLDTAELKTKLEERFQIEIPVQKYSQFATVQDILDYLNKVLPEKI